MQKNKSMFISVVLIAVVLIGWQLFSKRFLQTDNELVTIRIENKTISAERVTDDAKLALGLGGRQGICQDCGMLFVFPQKGDFAFWMKGMRFPLDLLWLADGKVVHVEKNVAFDDKRVFHASIPADMVLEVNAGFCEQAGIREGSAFTLN